MSVVLVSQPKRDDINGLTKTSRWTAAHHPQIYRFQRKDFAITSVMDSGGFIKIAVVSGGVLNVGDQIYLASGPYAASYTITWAGISSAILDGAFISNSTGGYYNNLTARANYRLNVRVYWSNASNAYELVGTSRYYPDATGALTVDVSAYSRRKCSLKNTCTFNTINQAEPTMGGTYNITYQENWTGSNEAFTSLLPSLKNYYVNAARQIGDRYGSNLGEFVPFNDSDPIKGRFLQLVGKPVYFPGFPFSIDFIYSDRILGIGITREVEFLDVNGDVISSQSDAINTTSACTLRVNHLMLPPPPAGCTEVRVWLSGDNSITPVDSYVRPTYTADSYFASPAPAQEPQNPIE